jgi:hypothetical protein
MILIPNTDMSTDAALHLTPSARLAPTHEFIASSLHRFAESVQNLGSSLSLGIHLSRLTDAHIGYARLHQFDMHRLSAHIQSRDRWVVVRNLRRVLWPGVDVNVFVAGLALLGKRR